MILYLTDNLLKIDRVLPLDEHQYCPAREDGIASIDGKIENIRALIAKRINFIVEFGPDENPPESFKTLGFMAHPDALELKMRWLVPPYWQPEIAFYDVEYKIKDDTYEYKNKITVTALEKGIAAGFKITRVYSENGLSVDFLKKFNLRIRTRDKFRYAVPIKIKKV